jgi:hypothetical protein
MQRYYSGHKISAVRAASVAVLMPQRILLFGSIARPALHKLDVPPDPWPEAPFARIQGRVVGILPPPNWRASTKKQATHLRCSVNLFRGLDRAAVW